MGVLQDEITNDPLGRDYAGMTDQQLVDSGYVLNRTRNRLVMSGSEVANQIDVGEFNGLTAGNEAKIWNVLHLGEINPFGIEATIFQNVFGASATVNNLQAARVESIGRWEEIGVGNVTLRTIRQEIHR